MNMIEMTHISKTYRMGDHGVHALADVDFAVEEGEFVAIVGPSGSGKSTLMNIIGCLDMADEGRYLLAGTDVSTMSERALARMRNQHIGFVFQQFNLLQKLTAAANVELPLIYQNIAGGERKQRVQAVLDSVGLSDRTHHRPNALSGGQQQRVAIARALVTRPSLLLADEPTGNLDSRSGREIIALLHELHGRGHTILLITHDINVAMEAQRRVYLADGQLSPEKEESII